MWENTVERGRSQMAIWRMRIECRITKATKIHSEYVILRFVENSGYSNALQCDVCTYVACLVTFGQLGFVLQDLQVPLPDGSDGNRSCANSYLAKPLNNISFARMTYYCVAFA
jgi:hypothetical protein